MCLCNMEIMFCEIEQIILFKHLSKRELAAFLSMSYGTLMCKLRGEYDFTLNEAVKLKEFLHSELSIEDLFVFTPRPENMKIPLQ